MNIIKIFLIFALCAGFYSQLVPGCQQGPNLQPVINATPQFINSTKHGKRYYIEDPSDDQIYAHIAILEGTSYEMGYAMGELFYTEMNEAITVFQEFIFNLGTVFIGVFPPFMQEWELSSDGILEMGLHFIEVSTKHYTPQRFYDELNGLSMATGIPVNSLLQINLFPELTRATCTILGAWGPATPTGDLYHLRALDFLNSAPFNIYSAVTIYRSTEPGSQHFANFGWLGMIGSLAGYNGLVGVGERVFENSNDDISTPFGEPWMFVLRDLIQFGTDLENSYEILWNANRTYDMMLGVGSLNDNSFRGFRYNYIELLMYTDQNWSAPFSPSHPQMDGVVYWDKNDGSPCMANILYPNYGNITAEMMFRNITSQRQSGDTIVAVYSYQTNEVYLSFATNLQPAYDNPLFLLNMTTLFNIPIGDDQ